jgi:DNA-binding Lrp family transcriptional regulator
MEKTIQTDEIQKQIIELLKQNKGLPFGELVKELDFSYKKILKNVIALRQKGMIKKANNLYGYYALENV